MDFKYVIFYAVFFISYTIQAISGFAGNVISMPVGVECLGMPTSIFLLNACSFFSCGAIAYLGRKNIRWDVFKKSMIIMVPFFALGIWLDSIISLDILMVIYGVVVLFIALKNLLVKKEFDAPEWVYILFIVLAGLMQGMFVSGGAFLVVYTMHVIKDKEEFRSTLSLVWCILNFTYSIICMCQGTVDGQCWILFAIAFPIFIAATLWGNWLAKRVKQESFITLTNVLLLVTAVVVLASNI